MEKMVTCKYSALRRLDTMCMAIACLSMVLIDEVQYANVGHGIDDKYKADCARICNDCIPGLKNALKMNLETVDKRRFMNRCKDIKRNLKDTRSYNIPEAIRPAYEFVVETFKEIVESAK